jgi:hypothetical protein
MKKYFLAITAIALAIVFSSFTKPFANKVFRLKAGVDKTNSSAIQLKSNWEEGTITCNTSSLDIPCTITLDEAFTSVDGDGVRTLNTSGSFITIQTENGLLDQTVVPNVQYIRVANGSNYTPVNKVK